MKNNWSNFFTVGEGILKWKGGGKKRINPKNWIKIGVKSWFTNLEIV